MAPLPDLDHPHRRRRRRLSRRRNAFSCSPLVQRSPRSECMRRCMCVRVCVCLVERRVGGAVAWCVVLARTVSHSVSSLALPHTHTLPATQPTYLNTQPTTVLFVFVYLPIYLVGRVYLSIFVSSPPNIFLLSISFINRRLMCILVIIIFSFII